MNQFEGTIWAKYDIMEQTFKHHDFGFKVEEILEKKTDNDIKLQKCNQCASSQASALRIHYCLFLEELPNEPKIKNGIGNLFTTFWCQKD